MKRVKLFLLLLTAGIFTSCLNNNDRDRVKAVDMIFYPEIGYGGSIMSDVITEQIIFSDSEDRTKRQLSDIILEGFDFEYEIGYEYTFKANKIWMSNPPQDVLDIKYEFIGPMNRNKVLTVNSEEELTITVKPNLVKFVPRFSEPDERNIYDAMKCVNKDDNKTIVIKEIEGFDFEVGHEYELRVKRFTTAEPFSQRYELVEIVEQN